MDLKDYIKEKQEVFKQLNPAIDKTLSDDAEERKEGRKGLERLRDKDGVVLFAIGNAYQIEYSYTGNPEDVQKVVEECKRIANEGYVFVVKSTQDLEARLEN